MLQTAPNNDIWLSLMTKARGSVDDVDWGYYEGELKVASYIKFAGLNPIQITDTNKDCATFSKTGGYFVNKECFGSDSFPYLCEFVYGM